MHLAIFGATGGVGRHLVSQAPAEGHRVTAFSRDAARLGTPDPDLDVVEGDVLDGTAVRQAIEGRDAVVCALGMPLLNGDGLRAAGTDTIIRAMQASDVRRLVCPSGLGAGDSRDLLPFHYRYLIFPLVMRRLHADYENQERLVMASGLDWTLVRPSNFTDGERTGRYRRGFSAAEPAPKLKVSRADVADFMLRQICDLTYLHRAPALSY